MNYIEGMKGDTRILDYRSHALYKNSGFPVWRCSKLWAAAEKQMEKNM